MSEFVVMPPAIQEEKDTIKALAQQMDIYIARTAGIANAVSLGNATEEIRKDIKAAAEQLTREKKQLKDVADVLQMIVSIYSKTETTITNQKDKNTVPPMKKAAVPAAAAASFVFPDISEWFERIKELAKELGLSFWEAASFIKDLAQLMKDAGGEFFKFDDTDWEKWFMKYVPQEVDSATVLGIMSILSVTGVSKKEREEHSKENKKGWEKYQKDHGNSKYIEDQNAMTYIKYGNHGADYNACEVIAAYNALQALNDGKSPKSFPDLLTRFEKQGIVLGGEFGTAPQDINKYFKDAGYQTKMLLGEKANASNLSSVEKSCDTYIMTTYNDKNNLDAMVHTVSITKENGKYVIHNAGDSKTYNSLEDAVKQYNNGNGKPICVIGITK